MENKVCKNCYKPIEDWEVPLSTIRRRVFCSKECYKVFRQRHTTTRTPHYSREEWRQKWSIYHLKPTRENLSKILEEMTLEDLGKIKNYRAEMK